MLTPRLCQQPRFVKNAMMQVENLQIPTLAALLATHYYKEKSKARGLQTLYHTLIAFAFQHSDLKTETTCQRLFFVLSSPNFCTGFRLRYCKR